MNKSKSPLSIFCSYRENYTYEVLEISYSQSLTHKANFFAGYEKRNMDINPVTKPLAYNLSCLQNM